MPSTDPPASSDQPARVVFLEGGDTHAHIDGVLYVRVEDGDPAAILLALVSTATVKASSTNDPDAALQWLSVAEAAHDQRRRLTLTRTARTLEQVIDTLTT